MKLNKYICKLANLKCTYILVRQVFKGDNYSREETINLLDFFSATSIQGRQLFKGGNYLRKYPGKSARWCRSVRHHRHWKIYREWWKKYNTISWKFLAPLCDIGCLSVRFQIRFYILKHYDLMILYSKYFTTDILKHSQSTDYFLTCINQFSKSISGYT